MEGRNISGFVNPAHTLKFPYKIFIKGQELNNDNSGCAQKCLSSTPNKTLSGEDTKTFYECLINDDISESNSIECVKQSSNLKLKEPLNRKVNFDSNPSANKKFYKLSSLSKKEILLAIENDDIEVLKSALNGEWKNEIIFGKDQYGWTSLMIAACAGSLETVKVLLQKGASVTEKDRSGNTCLTLARKRRNHSVINYINLYISGQLSDPGKSKQVKTSYRDELVEVKKCELCNLFFHSHRLSKQHFSSTIHLLNLERKELEDNGGHPKVHYGISQANRGFQMMLSSGWDSNVGLGPTGKGKLYPVKTVLKRDKYGLGLETSNKEPTCTTSKKAKVTHFGPYDSSSVKSDAVTDRAETSATLNKKDRSRKKSKLKQKEINFRREFMTI